MAGESPADATVAVDAGAHMFAAANFWRASEPLHFLISNGLASMGFAVSAAIAAALVRPESVSVAITPTAGSPITGSSWRRPSGRACR